MPFKNPSGYKWSWSGIVGNAPTQSGVYGIFNEHWVYIGESQDVQRRLLDHWGGDNSCITGGRPTGFIYELVSGRDARVRRQDQLILELHPSCNKRLG